MNRNIRKMALAITAITMAGCSGGSKTEQPDPSTEQSVNAAPTISGNPVLSIVVNEPYSFIPSASDADGDALTFNVENLPDWATLDNSTGELAGTPTETTDIGLFADITISVTDGQASAALTPFSVEVMDQTIVPEIADWPASVPQPTFAFDQIPGLPTRAGELPQSLAAGEILTFTGQASGDNDLTLACAGTEADPAFIIGGTLTSNDSVLRVSGSWCIFVDTILENTRLITAGSHLIFRNIEQRNSDSHNGLQLGGSDIVLIDSEIHHNQGDDRHGVHASQGSSRIWILRNHIHHNGGDGFQACHGCDANPPTNIYIGQNVIHSDRENAIDFKYIENVVVSENILYGYKSAPEDTYWCFDDGSGCGIFSSGSDGSAIVIGSDGGPTNVLVVDNEIYDSVNGVRIERAVETSLVGNDIHDVDNMCLALEKEGQSVVFDDNLCSGAARGIHQYWRVDFSLFVTNSRFSNISGPAIEYESGQVGENSTLESNRFQNTGPVIYNQTIAVTEDEINSLPNASGNSLIN